MFESRHYDTNFHKYQLKWNTKEKSENRIKLMFHYQWMSFLREPRSIQLIRFLIYAKKCINIVNLCKVYFRKFDPNNVWFSGPTDFFMHRELSKRETFYWNIGMKDWQIGNAWYQVISDSKINRIAI